MNKRNLLTAVVIAATIFMKCNAQSKKPEQYLCLPAEKPLVIDGKLSDEAWAKAAWTNEFVDIEGDKKPKPLHRTRAKMLWDDQYFYIAAEIKEPHLWATYDQRDAVIYHENDFEVFIDPDGDTHQYYELEINALGTVWDLMLIKPYRDGGPAINGWDISGLKKGIQLNGTLNNPEDTDQGWTVELAMPWGILKEAAKGGKKPVAGDTWRVNFSRVNWKTENSNGTYVKQIDPSTGKSYPEFNWVWSPQGVIAMHQPETWGFVTFADREGKMEPFEPAEERSLLREVYYAQKAYFKENGTFAKKISQLDLKNITDQPIDMYCTPSLFEAIINGQKVDWHIDQDGRIWETLKK